MRKKEKKMNKKKKKKRKRPGENEIQKMPEIEKLMYIQQNWPAEFNYDSVRFSVSLTGGWERWFNGELNVQFSFISLQISDYSERNNSALCMALSV